LGFLLKVPEVESNVQNRIGDLVNRGANLGMNTAASRLMQDPTRSVIH
jgi:hypothetical protein